MLSTSLRAQVPFKNIGIDGRLHGENNPLVLNIGYSLWWVEVNHADGWISAPDPRQGGSIEIVNQSNYDLYVHLGYNYVKLDKLTYGGEENQFALFKAIRLISDGQYWLAIHELVAGINTSHIPLDEIVEG